MNDHLARYSSFGITFFTKNWWCFVAQRRRHTKVTNYALRIGPLLLTATLPYGDGR